MMMAPPKDLTATDCFPLIVDDDPIGRAMAGVWAASVVCAVFL